MKLNQTSIKLLAGLTSVLTLTFLPIQNNLADHALVLTSDIEFSCDQTENNLAIKCSYRFVEPDLTKKISATLNKTDLPIKDISTYPFENSSTSILFLVDSSKSENSEQLQQIKSHVVSFAQQALPYQQVGLASFDTNLKVLNPIGSDPEKVEISAEEILVTDQPTELYRNLLDALELLKATQADRKSVYLFSTGNSEDQAIYHSDVVRVANEANIKVISIGYPSNEGSTDTTQNLQLLAKDTGGTFFKASENDLELPESLISDPFAAIDNGGVLSIDLTPALSGEIRGVQVAMLMFETVNKRITVKLPIELSSADNSTAILLKENTSAITDKPNEESQKIALDEKTPIKDIQGKNPSNLPKQVSWLPESVFKEYIPPIIIALLLFVILALVRSRSKDAPKAEIDKTSEEADDDQPLAYLVSISDESQFYPINSSPWKIGRTRENDLFLEHSSVSRNHAELKRNRDGSFTVKDLDSLNGVYVNNTKTATSIIQDEDKVDIGDVRMKFVLHLKES